MEAIGTPLAWSRNSRKEDLRVNTNVQKLTFPEVQEIKGGMRARTEGGPGGTSGCTGSNNCVCVCGRLPEKM